MGKTQCNHLTDNKSKNLKRLYFDKKPTFEETGSQKDPKWVNLRFQQQSY